MGPLFASIDWQSAAAGGSIGAVVVLAANLVTWAVQDARTARRRRERAARRAETYARVLAERTEADRPRADLPEVKARIEAGVREAESWIHDRNPNVQVQVRIGPESGPDGPVVEVEVQDGEDRDVARLDRTDLRSEHLIHSRVIYLWLGLRLDRIGRPEPVVA